MDLCETLMARVAGRVILLAGGSGFLGVNLSRKLADLGATVHVASRHRRTDFHPAVQWRQTDFTDPEQTNRTVEDVKPDILYCLTTAGIGRPDIEVVVPVFIGDLATTVHLMTAAARTGVSRLVLVSSLEEPFDERNPFPSSPYAAAKTASTVYAGMFGSVFKLPITAVRPYMTYGPGQSEAKVIAYAITSLLEGKQPRLSSCERPIDWIYVDDVVSGMIAAATSPDTIGASIDLGSGELVTAKVLIEKARSVMGTSVTAGYGALPDRPQEKVRAADLAPAREKLGWTPKTSIDNGVTATVAWFETRMKAREASQAT